MKESSFFDSSQFMPHGMCYLWQPEILWTTVISDLIIALSYYSVTVAVFIFVRRREDLPYPWFFILAGSIVFVTCGTAHLVSAFVVWEPIYGVLAIIKTATALGSLAMGIVIWFVLPFFVALPSPAMLEIKVKQRTDELKDSNTALNEEILMHRQAQEALSVNEARFRDFADIGADWFWEMGPDYRYTYVAGNMSGILGILPEDVIGKASGEVNEVEMGEESPKLQEYTEIIRAHRPLQNFNMLWHKPDGDILTISLSAIPLFDENGTFTGYRGTGRDVSEMDRVEKQLRRSQKMDAIGQLTGGIAHDFNNILGIILGNLELLQLKPLENPKMEKRVQTIEKSALRATQLTKQLLGFSRSQPATTDVTDVNRLIVDMESLIARAVTPEIEVGQSLAEDLWLTQIDPGDCQDALLNLIINARDVMPGGGTLTVETSNQTLDEMYCNYNQDAVPGDYIQIAISDSGAGISQELQERIFEPFFTTKEKGKGTGLGLSMVYGFVKRSKGHIKVYSELGMGTTFRVFLPRSGGEVSQQGEADDASTSLPTGTETILVVDDEQGLRDLAEESLKALGYRVLTAANGPEALEVLASEPGIQLLFSDVVMPGGINGYELAERAGKLYPNLKLMLTSGYTEKAVEHKKQMPLEASLITKPYTQKSLAKEVRDMLEKAE